MLWRLSVRLMHHAGRWIVYKFREDGIFTVVACQTEDAQLHRCQFKVVIKKLNRRINRTCTFTKYAIVSNVPSSPPQKHPPIFIQIISPIPTPIRPVIERVFSEEPCLRTAFLSALALVHCITTWYPYSFSMPQIWQVGSISIDLCCLLVCIARESVASFK